MSDNPFPPSGAEEDGAARPGARVAGRLVMLSSAMRAGGAPVGAGRLLKAHRALLAIDLGDRAECYFALRGVLCCTDRDREVFDAAFGEVFRDARAAPAAIDDGWLDAHPEFVPEALERLRRKDFADYTAVDLDVARRRLARLTSGPVRAGGRNPSRPGRRGEGPRFSRASGPRDARGGGGERHWSTPGQRPRALVVVCAAERALAPYARAVLAYAEACVGERRRVEAFAYGDRVARLTAQLRAGGADAALAAMSAPVDGDGADLAAVLAAINADRGVRGADVLLLTEGAVDPAEPQLAQLASEAHRVVVIGAGAADARDDMDSVDIRDLGALEQLVESLEATG